jgi:hypothetical protein
MNPSILYPEDVFNAYNKHGENFLIIDLSTIKENQAKTVKYCQLKIKKENGVEVVPIIKLFNLAAAGKIKAPVDREYEQLKIALRRDDESNKESPFGKAMELICNVFTKRVKELKTEGLINDDDDDENNKPNVTIVPCCRPQTPFQKKAKNKQDQTVNLENPMIWIGLNYKRYTMDEEKQLEALDINYKNDGKPFLVKDFDLNIYDLEKVVNKKPQMALDSENTKITNANVHKFITINSLISGTVYMQVVMSKQSFNLNTRLTKNLYVKSNKNATNSSHMFDDDEFDMMVAGSSKLDNSNAPTSLQEDDGTEEKRAVEDDETEEKEDCDYGSDVEDQIKNLKFT